MLLRANCAHGARGITNNPEPFVRAFVVVLIATQWQQLLQLIFTRSRVKQGSL